MGINGHALSLEQKILRRIQATWHELDDADDEKLKRIYDGMLPSQRLKFLSDVLEEIFK